MTETNSEHRAQTTAALTPDQMSVELSSRRTGMSFQRTRMSADRTLMSVIRTALSLISFGFTIAQAFEHLVRGEVLYVSARRFGLSLVLLGIVMLVVGIVYHVQFMRGLRHERVALKAAGMIHAESRFPTSMTLITGITLLGIGLAAIVSILFHVGPFAV